MALTLRFVALDGTYAIVWEAPSIGRYTSSFELPYRGEMLALVLRALDIVQHKDYLSHEPFFAPGELVLLRNAGLWQGHQVAPDILRRVGQRLYRALIADPNAERALLLARHDAAARHVGVEYALRLPPDARELLATPWELLWDEHAPLLVDRGSPSSCVRYLDLAQPLPPARAQSPRLRVLFITPEAGLDRETREHERFARLRALGGLRQAGEVVLDELVPATFEHLVDQLRSGPPVDIVHFYGHGRVRPGVGELLFDAADGKARWVAAERLATVFKTVQLVSLHACHSNAADEVAPLAGVAAQLLIANVHAVLAMQCSVRSDAAARFAASFFHGLLRGEALQHAVAQGRQILYAEEADQKSWFVPTLSIRALNNEPLHLLERSSS